MVQPLRRSLPWRESDGGTDGDCVHAAESVGKGVQESFLEEVVPRLRQKGREEILLSAAALPWPQAEGAGFWEWPALAKLASP